MSSGRAISALKSSANWDPTARSRGGSAGELAHHRGTCFGLVVQLFDPARQLGPRPEPLHHHLEEEGPVERVVGLGEVADGDERRAALGRQRVRQHLQKQDVFAHGAPADKGGLHRVYRTWEVDGDAVGEDLGEEAVASVEERNRAAVGGQRAVAALAERDGQARGEAGRRAAAGADGGEEEAREEGQEDLGRGTVDRHGQAASGTASRTGCEKRPPGGPSAPQGGVSAGADLLQIR